ncbi:hypothetical protein ACFL43_00405 [Thermodesulfobacteriota bacterium]
MKKNKPVFTQDEIFKMGKIYKAVSSEVLQWFGAIGIALMTIFMFVVAYQNPSLMSYIIAFTFLGGYLYLNFTKNKVFNVWDSHLIDRSIYRKIKQAKGDD